MTQTPVEDIPAHDSILASTKKILGIPDEITDFDLDVMTHINSVFDTLAQLGVGPVDGFMIAGRDETWDQYFETRVINSVKTYVYLRVRILFDPPTTSYAITAVNEQIKELEYRLNVLVDTDPGSLGDPDPIAAYLESKV